MFFLKINFFLIICVNIKFFTFLEKFFEFINNFRYTFFM